jgi:hypothetical protein
MREKREQEKTIMSKRRENNRQWTGESEHKGTAGRVCV